MSAVEGLNPRQRKFAEVFVDCLGQPSGIACAKAYGIAYNCPEKMKDGADRNAEAVLYNPKVQAYINELKAESAKDVIYQARDVLKDWINIATARPDDLIKYIRTCCRHCHGENHKYQWRDEAEYWEAWARAVDEYEHAEDKSLPLKEPDRSGGFGFDHVIEPHPGCHQCEGRGQERVHVTDTEHLTGKARQLYRGVKVTRGGLEVLMADQDRARENIAKHFGMFVERVELGGEMVTLTADVKDAHEAAAIYQRLMKGG